MTDTASDKPTDMSDSLSVTEAAARLGVSERTVWRRIKQGKLKTHKTTDGVRVSLSDIPSTVSDSVPVSDSKATDNTTDTVSDVPGEVIELVRLVDRLQQSNQQLAGQVGYLQRQVIEQQETIQRLLPAPKDEPEPPAASEPKRVWWRRLLGQ